MHKGQQEQNRLVHPSEGRSGTEGWHAQTRYASDQPDQHEIDGCMVVNTDKVTGDERHTIVAAEWMTPCNELF
jgi:hypothetical protein